MTRRERLALFAALLLCDEHASHPREVQGGMRELRRLTSSMEPEHFRKTVQMLERRGYLRRYRSKVGTRFRTRIFVAYTVFLHGDSARRCENCLEALPLTLRSAARWCDGCRQTVGRSDRAWQIKAIDLCVEGKSPTEIRTALKRPLWRAPDSDNQSSAIVPFLLSEGLLGEQWREALRRALEGGGE